MTSKGQGSRIEGRGTEVKIHRSQGKVKVPVGCPVNHCSAAGPQMLFPTKKHVHMEQAFSAAVAARVLIASRAFSFVVVNLFVDKHFFLFFSARVPQNDTVCKSHQQKSVTYVTCDTMSTLEEMRFQSIQALRCEKLRGGPSRVVVPDVRGCCVSQLHGCNPWREDSATPHPGSCQRPVEDPRPATVSRIWRGAEVFVHVVRRRLLRRLHEFWIAPRATSMSSAPLTLTDTEASCRRT